MTYIARPTDLASPIDLVASSFEKQKGMRRKRKQSEAWQSYIVVGFCFSLFFIYHALCRLIPVMGPKKTSQSGVAMSERHKSLVSQAMADANKIMPFIFMR